MKIKRVTIDTGIGAAYIYLDTPERQKAKLKQISVGMSVIFDLDEEDNLFGIEILDWNIVKNLMSDETVKKLQKHGITVVEQGIEK